MRKSFRGIRFRTFIPFLLSLFVVILFSNTPVLKDFSYEAAMLYAVLFFLSSSVYVLLKRKRIGRIKSNLRIVLFQLASVIVLPLIGGAVTCYHAGFDCFLHGARYYFVFAIPAFITGTGITAYAVSISRKYAIPLWILLFLFLLFLIAREIYLYPQVYSYNPIIGFYPGVIYDELLPLSARHLVYRLITSIYFLLPLLAIAQQERRKNLFRFLSITFPVLGICFYLLSPTLGFATTETTLRKALPEEIVTEHFSIHLPAGRFDRYEKAYIARLHEWSYEENVQFFNCKPRQQIQSFLFMDDAQKYKLTGAGAADIAKPWLSEICITGNDYPATLKHEIAHVFTAEFGASPLKLAHNFNFLLLEGAATASDGLISGKDIDYLSALALQQHKAPDMPGLYSGFNFFSANTALAYTLSGSFCSYMITKYGIENFKTWYQAGYDSTLFGKSLAACWADFSNDLLNHEYRFADSAPQLYFGTPPFVYKRFPRYVAAKKQSIDKLIESKQFGAALSGIERLHYFSNEPGILFREVFLLDTLGMNTRALQLMREFTVRNTHSPYYFNALLRLGDLYVKADLADSAGQVFSKLQAIAPNDEYAIAARFRLTLLDAGQYAAYLAADAAARFDLLVKFYTKNPNTSVLWQILQTEHGSGTDHYELLYHLLLSSNTHPLPPALGLAFCELALKKGDLTAARTILGFIPHAGAGQASRFRLLREHISQF